MAISITQTDSTNTTDNLPKKRNVYDNYDKLKSVVHYDSNNQVDFVLKGTNNPTGKSLKTKKYQQVHIDVVQSPTGISFDRATLRARIYKNDNSKVSETGFIVWTGDQTDSVLNKTKSGDTLVQPAVLKGSFTKQILNLPENTTYNYRAYVTHEYGTNYSKVYQFTTTSFSSVFSIAGTPTSGPAPLTVNLSGINAGTGITSYAWSMTGGPISFEYSVSGIDVTNPGSGYETVTETVVLINNTVQPTITANISYFEGTDTFGISSIDVPAEVFGFTNSARTVAISSNGPVTENATGTASGNIQVIADYTTQAITHTYLSAGTFNPIVYAINGNQVVKQATRPITVTGGGGVNYSADWTAITNSSYGNNIVAAYDFRNVPNSSLKNSLLAFWKLDDLTDSSGNGNTLTNNSNVTFDAGKIGNAAEFSSGKFLSRNMEFNTYSSDWSFSVWMYQTNTPNNINTFPLVTDNLANHWALQCNPDGEVGFGYYVDGGLWGPLPLNTWTHVAGSCTNGVVTLYINGVSQGSGSFTGQNDGNEFRLNTGFGDQVYNGKLDAVGLWHRALTEEEIDLLYNSGAGTESIGTTVDAIVGPDLALVGNTVVETDGDPFFNNVGLLLNMNGTNGSQVFVDSSTNNLSLTANGNVQISNSVVKYGNGAAYFDGSGDFIEVPSNPAFDFGSGDFTIECWFNTNNPNWQSLITRWGNGNNNIFLGVAQIGIQFYLNNSYVVGGGTFNLSTWNHIAIVRSGTNIIYFLNGVLVNTANWGSGTVGAGNSDLRIGYDNNVNPYFDGYIDDVRITKGVARYIANFTPPQAELSNIGGENIGVTFTPSPAYAVSNETISITQPHTLVYVGKADATAGSEAIFMACQPIKYSQTGNQNVIVFSRPNSSLMPYNGADNNTTGYLPTGNEWFYAAFSFLTNNTVRYAIRTPSQTLNGITGGATHSPFNGYTMFGAGFGSPNNYNVFGTVRLGMFINSAFSTVESMNTLFTQITAGPANGLLNS